MEETPAAGVVSPAVGLHNPKPLPPKRVYYRHLAQGVATALTLIAASLAIGILGYSVFGHMRLVDATLEASMILAGMGPVAIRSDSPTALKWFSSVYALFSGVMFLTSVSVMLGPVVHRFLHRFHLEESEPSR